MDRMERMLGGTRRELLELLRRSRRSIGELAGALGITQNAVRMHVGAMQADGLVKVAGVERATGGKPAQLYEITPEAEELFPKAYAVVLRELLRVLEERVGGREVEALLREVGSRAAAGRTLSGMEEEARIAAAAEVLRALGGEVEVERENGGWRIRGYGCPLSAVVAGHAEVCGLAESLVAEITGLPVRECCNREGRPRCGFQLGPVATSGSVEGR